MSLKILLVVLLLSFSLKSLARENGEVIFVAFENGSPSSLFHIIVDHRLKLFSTSNGEIRISLESGSHQVQLVEAEKPIHKFTVNVLEDQLTQVIINLLPSPQIEIESPLIVKTPNTPKNTKERGTLKGLVVEDKDGKPISNARIFARGESQNIVTNDKGEFEIKLNEGINSISIIHPNFSTKRINDIRILKDSITQTRIKMFPSALDLEEFVVLAPHIKGSLAALIEVRRRSSSVADVLGAEQIAKTGDSDVASSLRRVTGLTLVDGKYVYVRGLGERYSSVQLNDGPLPSPDPYRRVVPLDIFPTSIIENMVVQKSYSPDMPGEFGGGAIQIKTKSIPEKFFAKVSISTTINEVPDFAKTTYKGGKTDIWGKDDGTRALPNPIRKATAGNKKIDSSSFTDQEIAELGRSFPNIYNVNKSSQELPPNFSVALGDSYKFSKVKTGFLTSFTYGNSLEGVEKTKTSYAMDNGQLTKDEAFTYKNRKLDVNLGGTLDLGVEIGKNHSLSGSGILVRKSSDQVQIKEGNLEEDLVRSTKLDWKERQIFSRRLQGKHIFSPLNDFQIDWRLVQADATLYEPDRREYRYELEETSSGGVYRLSNKVDGNQRIYTDMKDRANFGALDLTLPFQLWKKSLLKIKVGYSGFALDRKSITRRFGFDTKVVHSTVETSAIDAERLRESDPETAFSRDNIRPDGFVLKDLTRSTDNYNAHQKLQATYGMVDLSLAQRLNFLVGARWEQSVQDVHTFDLFDPSVQKIAYLETNDLLPVYTTTWKFTKKQQLRLAYSETLSRPDFRELSDSTYTDDINDREVKGNIDLVSTVIYNTDLRWEWYPTSRDNLSFGFFYKDFDKPIEMVVRSSTDGVYSFDNAKRARNFGAELEFKKQLDFVSRTFKDFSFAGNYSYIHSRVELSEKSKGIQTSDKRPLQGQSPYIANIQLMYERQKWGTSATFAYNVFGERIATVGSGTAPDIMEQPFHQLDFVLGQKLGKNYKFGFKAKNLLDSVVKLTQGSKEAGLYKKGQSYSLSLSGSY